MALLSSLNLRALMVGNMYKDVCHAMFVLKSVFIDFDIGGHPTYRARRRYLADVTSPRSRRKGIGTS